MKKFIKSFVYMFLVLVIPIVAMAGPVIDEGALSKLNSKQLVAIIKCLVGGTPYEKCLPNSGGMTITSPYYLALDINGTLDVRGTGFAPKGNKVTMMFTESGTGKVADWRGPIYVNSTSNGTALTIPLKLFNLSDKDIQTWFKNGEYQQIEIERPDTGARVIFYVSISKDLVADKIAIAGRPTLTRTYNAKTKAETLTANFKITVRAENNSRVTISKQNAFYIVADSADEKKSAGAQTITYSKPSGTAVTEVENQYIIKDGGSAIFTVKAVFNPLHMFAGSYRARLAMVAFVDETGNNYAYQQISKTLLLNNTAYVNVLGERSPYITTQVAKDGADPLLVFSGVRFEKTMPLYVNGVDKFTVTSTDGKSFSFKISDISLNLPQGTHQVSFQVEGIKEFPGKSNIVYETITIGGGGGQSETTNNSPCPVTTPGFAFTRNLSVGSMGADVTALQCFLISKGYLTSNVNSGYFGVLTKSAVGAYQKSVGLDQESGYFGPITRAKVNSEIASNTSGANLNILLVSKSISKSQTSQQNNTSTSTAEARFDLKLSAVGGDVVMKTVGNAGGSFLFKIIQNGTSVNLNVNQGVSYDIPAGVAVATDGSGFLIAEGNTVTIPVSFAFEGRTKNSIPVPTASYAVDLSGILWKRSNETLFQQTSYLSASDSRTSSVSLP